MKVTIYEQPNNPIKTVTDIASMSYGNEYAKNPEKLFKHLAKRKHLSVFEFVDYTFKIENISRACQNQLVRHRHNSYNVKSQRYTSEDDFTYYTPKSIQELQEALDIYLKTMDYINNSYKELIKLGIPKEDARMILPNATHTDMYIKLNLRSLMEMYPKRNSKAAQEEIRELVNKMVDCIECELVKEVIYEHDKARR